ncbi:transglutaminase domain-containing protein [Microbacterium sp. bgisy189]|uniref:transglutaminase domain-containing protein n=1 Tax=Microbacterium sp. bgisy189 TaxID=3413798 RepID=UPI003EBD8EB5
MRATTARIVSGALFAFVTAVLAAIAAWPIYRSGAFLTLVAVASAVAALIAAVVTWRRWSGWAAAGLLAAAVFVLGVPLAVPGRVGGAAELLRGLGDLAAGFVLGWKDLLTVDLPVGSYRNLLVPALAVFLVGTCVVLLLAWRADRLAYGAVPPALAMVWFGLLFGRASVSSPWVWGPIRVPAPVETAVGIGALLAGVLWLSWRARDRRRRALERAAESSGVRLRRRIGRGDTRRVALGVGMLAVAAVGVAAVVPAAAEPVERTVLRGSVGPEVQLSEAVSPLTSYRTLFADDVYATVLFTVTGASVPERVRLAVLDDYDGAEYRTGVSGSSSRFVRVPAETAADPGVSVDAFVGIGMFSDIWMPVAGDLAAVDFEGIRAATLADGFYYSDDLDAAVQTQRWNPGDRYRLRATAAEVPALTDIEAPGSATGDVEPPPALVRWVEEHREGDGGAALASLVDLLRERGYLSHGLADTETRWRADLPGYDFAASAAGHSLARIDAMFQALLEREADPRALEAGNFVAAVGDDEQFAVAVSLIAQQLGFPSRVVVGARVGEHPDGLSACDAGGCRAGDISAWVEVRGAMGDWVPVDVTPQHEVVPSLEVAQQRDPEVPTQVDPDTIEEVTPPKPSQEDTVRDDDTPVGADLGWLWAALRIVGVSVGGIFLVLAPFLAILVGKALRRRRRRRAAAAAARISGGWDEFVDAAVDSGSASPGARTRVEFAADHGSAGAAGLAATADVATFSGRPMTPDEADEFWRIVERERRGMSSGLWHRLRAAVSLRSFVRTSRAARPGRRNTERGSRGRVDRDT